MKENAKMEKEQSIVAGYIASIVEEKTPVSVYISKGIGLKGIIVRTDEEAVVLERGGDETLIYKSNIVSISPEKSCSTSRDRYDVNGNW